MFVTRFGCLKSSSIDVHTVEKIKKQRVFITFFGTLKSALIDTHPVEKNKKSNSACHALFGSSIHISCTILSADWNSNCRVIARCTACAPGFNPLLSALSGESLHDWSLFKHNQNGNEYPIFETRRIKSLLGEGYVAYIIPIGM